MGSSCSQEDGRCSTAELGSCAGIKFGASRPHFEEFKPHGQDTVLQESVESIVPPTKFGRHGAESAHVLDGSQQQRQSPESKAQGLKPEACAADDTEEGAVVGSAFGHSKQASPWGHAEDIVASAQAEVMEVSDWVHENHITMRFICLCTALGLLGSSILMGIKAATLSLHPFQILFGVYNVFFAAIIVILDGRSTEHFRLLGPRKIIFESVWALVKPRGRASLYFYVGFINIIIAPDDTFLWLVYTVLGCVLCAAGLLVLSHDCACCKKFQMSQGINLDGISASRLAIMGISVIHEGEMAAKLEFMRIKAYVHHNPVTVKVFATFIGMFMFVISVMCLIPFWNVFFNTYQYVVACQNIIWSCVIILIDGPRDWLRQCWPVRQKVFTAAPCLGWLAGRGVFFLYVGSMNLVVLPENTLWRAMYWGLGGSLCTCGLLMLLHRFVLTGKKWDNIVGDLEEG